MDDLRRDDPPEIGVYRLLRRLGSGGMGVVYLAADPTGRRVAVKVIHPQWARDPGFRRRFDREVAAARRVARFCTAPVLDAGVDEERAYLVTEYVDGPDLAAAVRERGPLSGGNLEALAAGVAVALHAIHQAGVVHRDLKPSNVVLAPTGPRVIDFGVAQLVEPTSLPSQTLLGTPAFMAPELVRGEPVTPASDVFSWGALVVYAGTGRLPFGAGPPAEVLYRVVHEGPALDGLDPRMCALVERAMAKRPRVRPTAAQLLDELVGKPAGGPAGATQVVEQTWTPLPATATLPTAAAPSTDAAAAPSTDAAAAPSTDAAVPPAPAATAGRLVAGAGRWRRWAAVAAGLAALALLVVVGLRFGLAGDRAELPYQANFGDGWRQDATGQGGAQVRADGIYVLTSGAARLLVWRAAPVGEATDVVLTASARLTSGSGEFGVWCGGGGGDVARYRFAVDSAGRGAVLKDVAGAAPVALRGPAQPAGQDLGPVELPTDGWVDIAAQCRGGEAQPELAMWLDGSSIGAVTDPDGRARGEVGVFVYADDRGSATVQFRSFQVTAT